MADIKTEGLDTLFILTGELSADGIRAIIEKIKEHIAMEAAAKKIDAQAEAAKQAKQPAQK